MENAVQRFRPKEGRRGRRRFFLILVRNANRAPILGSRYTGGRRDGEENTGKPAKNTFHGRLVRSK
jgi:hypothetical protein